MNMVNALSHEMAFAFTIFFYIFFIKLDKWIKSIR